MTGFTAAELAAEKKKYAAEKIEGSTIQDCFHDNCYMSGGNGERCFRQDKKDEEKRKDKKKSFPPEARGSYKKENSGTDTDQSRESEEKHGEELGKSIELFDTGGNAHVYYSILWEKAFKALRE